MNLDDILNNLEQAMEKWFTAKKEHDAAFAEYEDYSWDWHGAEYIQNMEAARSEYRELFIKAINAQIEEDKNKNIVPEPAKPMTPDKKDIKQEIKRLLDLMEEKYSNPANQKSINTISGKEYIKNEIKKFIDYYNSL